MGLNHEIIQKILAKHCQAIGGETIIKKIQTWHLIYQLEVPFWEGYVEELAKAPNKSLAKVTSSVFNEMVGNDGVYQWKIDQNGRVQVLHEVDPALQTMPHVLPEYQYLFPNDLIELTYLGTEQINEKNYFKLKKKESQEEPEILYIDDETYLMARREAVEQGINITITYSDYRLVGGVQIPHQKVHHTHIMGVPPVKYILETIKLNEPLSDELFRMPGKKMDDFTIHHSEMAQQIPFELHRGHIYLKVGVNDASPANFVLDSGAGSTIISTKLADQLKLESSGEIPAVGVGGAQMVKAVDVEKFELPGVTIHHQRTFAMELSDIVDQTGVEIAGVLGYDLFMRFVVAIDYEHRRLALYDPQTFVYNGDGEILEGNLMSNILQVPGKIDEIEGDFRVDTGSSGCLHMSGDLFGQYYLLEDRKTLETGAFGIGGGAMTYLTRMTRLKLGKFEINHPIVALSFDENSVLSLGSTAGTLGVQILSKFKIYIDYSRKLLILEPNQSYYEPILFDKSGIRLKEVGGLLMIAEIIPGSPADEIDLTKNTVILKINHHEISKSDWTYVEKSFTEKDHTVVELEVIEDNEIKTKKLTLRSYF